MATVVPLFATLLAAATAAAAHLGQLRINVTGGTLVEGSTGTVGIWANSPDVRISVVNESQGFYNGQLRWLNVPQGSYLVSGRGVAEGASSSGGSLVASLSLAGGGRSQWRLEPNISKDFRFAVATTKTGLTRLPRTSSQRPNFAIQLGGTGIIPSMEMGGLDFPSYMLPGLHDTPAIVRKRLVMPYSAFGVGPDRFLLLDNRNYSLGKEQLEWAGKRLQDFRLDGARRVFVFMHRPPIDPRRNVRNGLSNKTEARRLGRLLKNLRAAAIFSGQVNRSYLRNWYGIRSYMLTDRDVIVVDSKTGELSVRLPVH